MKTEDTEALGRYWGG